MQIKKILKFLSVLILAVSWIFSGWPQIWHNPPIPPKVELVHAAVTVQNQYTTSGKKVENATVSSVNASSADAIYVLISAITKASGDGNFATAVAFQASGGDQAFTKLGELQNVQATIAVWYLLNPDQETANIFVTFSNNNATWDHYAIGVEVLSGVDVSGTPHDAWEAPSSGTGTSASHTVSAASGDLVYDIFTGDGTFISLTENGDGTQVWNLNGSTKGVGGSASLTATGNANMGWTIGASIPWAHGGVSINPVPVTTTTIGDGTNPGNSTIAPESGITDLDAVTFVTSSGTDSVSAATVTLGPAGAFNNIGEVRITSDDGLTLYFSAASNPSSNTVSFSGGTPIPVTNSSVQFKVRITPKTHANMPVVPGASYDTTGTVTSFTSTNSQAGSDSGSATITVDNLSPGNTTANSGSAGDTQVTINYTTPSDSDLNSVVVLRDTSMVTDNPAEGQTYTVGNMINTAVVACVDTTVSPSTADSCTDTGLTNDVAYYYEIFAKDNNGNYATGIVPSGSPFTPTGTSLTAIISTDVFPTVTPGGIAIFATSTIDVDTNSSSGWSVALHGDDQSDTDTVMDLIADASVSITDQTEWVPGAATTTAGNAVRIASFDSAGDVLAVHVMTASGTQAFIADDWWGTADDYADNANTLWAGIASTTASDKTIGNSSVDSGGGSALNTVLYYLKVPSAQQSGNYSGILTFTTVVNP